MDLSPIIESNSYLANVSSFQQQVYAVTKCIPKGYVTTYGAIASIIDSSPRAVGQALKKNPYAPKIPCHRVVAAKGIGGFFGATAGKLIDKKIQLLKQEGAFTKENRLDILDSKQLARRIQRVLKKLS